MAKVVACMITKQLNRESSIISGNSSRAGGELTQRPRGTKSKPYLPVDAGSSLRSRHLYCENHISSRRRPMYHPPTQNKAKLGRDGVSGKPGCRVRSKTEGARLLHWSWAASQGHRAKQTQSGGNDQGAGGGRRERTDGRMCETKPIRKTEIASSLCPSQRHGWARRKTQPSSQAVPCETNPMSGTHQPGRGAPVQTKPIWSSALVVCLGGH